MSKQNHYTDQYLMLHVLTNHPLVHDNA
uniref:Uncharacterized protein n=1 Tax=Rhizophora mucronata TaxID=61149 RepID=A0A2P2QEZ9_RHIMU